MPSRYLNRRRFEVAADGHTGNCGRVAVFNGCNVALGQTGTFGQKRSLKLKGSEGQIFERSMANIRLSASVEADSCCGNQTKCVVTLA